MIVLVTGALGFIGSHICVELLQKGYSVIAIDNLSNSKLEVFEKIRFYGKNIHLFTNDVQNLESVFRVFDIELVIHCAGSKSVNESIKNPLDYYCNNVCNTVALLETMNLFDCKNLIFSSSATVYGTNATYPVNETFKIDLNSITSPYGKTKCMIEEILIDLYKSDPKWNISILRYFNPIGHLCNLHELPLNQPNNLFPIIIQKVEKNEILQVYGQDYKTKDGTCIRDFIHVIDVAKAHIACIFQNGFHIYNIGTGKGTSVLELIHTFEQVNQKSIKFQIKPRRDGDIPIMYASIEKIQEELNWQPTKTLEDMCKI